jgi:hypothetical protein
MPQNIDVLLDQRDRRVANMIEAIKRGDAKEAGMLGRLLATTALLIMEKGPPGKTES